MSYQVLARKYRPQTFQEVLGQEHVTQTLVNAISSERVAHAILFTGPRGTGKTTIARILAKAMNCVEGPTPSPCNKCKTCTDIIQGHCSDVFEIDGASNNSVDQIRDLRENVAYMPASAPHKIYIIDEVHMLSTAAFNALLKTLEEPPSHVLFIFATTEVHKIPATILSRCQRHDLNRIPLSAISGHLKKLSSEEGFSVDPEGLDYIAMEADGSVRDGLSLLDRILSSSPGEMVGLESVVDSLGIPDRKLLFDISSAVFDRNGAALLDLIEKVDDSGLDLKKFYSDIILHFRNLSVIKLCGPDQAPVNLMDTEKEQIVKSVSQISGEYLGMLLQLLLKEESIIRFSSHTKTAVEMILLKMLRIRPDADLDLIVQRLDFLAKNVQTGQPRTEDEARPRKQAPEKRVHPIENVREGRESWGSGQEMQPETPLPEPPPGTVPLVPEPAQETHVPDLPRTWQGFLNHIESRLPFIFVLLTGARVKETDDKRIVAELENCSAFDKSRLENKKKELADLCRDFLGKTLAVNIVSENHPMETQEKKNDAIKAKQAAMGHPLVQDAIRMFDGKII
ncbi:DNA polymerase III subunit gamma/tau [Desulfospira joergensenii]|uniref:DNA polymerase III subunit gamma/tau n=1 Tax=Desulfospira joergensenii TaxID=53329 RepID=UPI0003B5651E|nr:DNA polymerase III subunit gamma/tau [Desulfospira joergensenii]